MKAEIRGVAQKTAARLRGEGLNAVDQLVGAFGPTMVLRQDRLQRSKTNSP